MERKYTVYMHINQCNKKKYIGITSDLPETRWRNGKGYKDQVFGKAIEKYGWNKFSHWIIAENLTQSQAESLEIALIEAFDTQNPECGYNITSGGGATLPSLCKQVYQYDKNGDLVGQYISYKQAERLSGFRADAIGLVCLKQRHTTGGYVWSNIPLSKEEVFSSFRQGEEARIAGTQLGITNAVKKISKRVQQLDPVLDIVIAEYSSQREAARAVGIDQKGISAATRGKQKTAGGYRWRIVENKS